MTNNPKITIVTVTYNCADSVLRTIESVTNQTFLDWELCIVDGASTDGTSSVISQFISDNTSLPIKFLSEKDNGIYDAMNKGIEMASGEWIFFLNVGDILSKPEILSDIYKSNDSGYSAIYTDVINQYDNEMKYVTSDRPFFADNHDFLNMGFGHQSVIVRTELAKKYKFDLNFKCCADYKMIRSIYSEGGRFLYVQLPLCITENRFGFSNEHVLLQAKELGDICKVTNTLRFKFYYCTLYVKTNIKRLIRYHQ